MRLGLWVSMFALVLAVGIPGATFAGPLLGDTDGDGTDDLFDTCLNVSNASQADADFDGCGNRCDADYDQDGTVGGVDFSTFRDLFDTVPGPSLRPTRDTTACP